MPWKKDIKYFIAIKDLIFLQNLSKTSTTSLSTPAVKLACGVVLLHTREISQEWSSGHRNTAIGNSNAISFQASWFKQIFEAFGPSLRGKAILSRDLLFFDFILTDPKSNTIGSKFNVSASQQYISLVHVISLKLISIYALSISRIYLKFQLCKLMNSTNFTKVKSPKNQNQHYAYSNVSWILFEDLDSAKSEV